MKQKLAFALTMGLITTAIISFVLIAINVGFGDKFLSAWLRSSYVLAVFSMLVIAPRIQFLVNSLFKENFTTQGDQ
jgi:Kef-type K+ transport system membrane component KefB